MPGPPKIEPVGRRPPIHRFSVCPDTDVTGATSLAQPDAQDRPIVRIIVTLIGGLAVSSVSRETTCETRFSTRSGTPDDIPHVTIDLQVVVSWCLARETR